ncbi:hypothetical protein [Niveispirillum fermenti]|uniref:hypothetical protein n=1 Tax=Niveispirillum fermenti TaxID=1233113 RepID=UPI003A84F61D
MPDQPPDRPPTGMEWLEWLETAGRFFDEWWLAGVALALLFNVSWFSTSFWLERRHHRRLTEIATPTAGILLLSGRPPAGAGNPILLQAIMVLASPPLGRLSVLLRRMIGGPIVTRQRDVERARRETLLRLRRAAVDRGADILAGLEYVHIEMGSGRTAVLATATGFTSRRPSPSFPTEAIGAVPPRPLRELLLIIAILVGLALMADAADRFLGLGMSAVWDPHRRWNGQGMD